MGSVRSSLPMLIKVILHPLTVLNCDGSGIKSKYCIDCFKNSDSCQVFVAGKLLFKQAIILTSVLTLCFYILVVH